jgi:hypothetical protein
MNHPAIILPTAYLPPVSWWVTAVHSGNILLEYQETYPKQTYRNRCHIYSANGRQALSIPVTKPDGNHTLTSGICIDYSKSWQMNHWRSIEAAYARTPYFIFYRDFLYPYFTRKCEKLVDFNNQLINQLISMMKLNITVDFTNDYDFQDPSADYRMLIHPKKEVAESGITAYPRYMQAFEPKYGFIPNLSIIDLLFHEGPSSSAYIRNIAAKSFNEQSGAQ